MDIQKWIDKYEKKIGHSIMDDIDEEFYPLLYVFEDGSFFFYTILTDRVEIGVASVDIHKAFEVAESVAKRFHLPYVGTTTQRNPKAYERLIKCKWVDTKEINGIPTYYMLKEVCYE